MERPRVVVVTGASYGVGRATAAAFARRGARDREAAERSLQWWVNKHRGWLAAAAVLVATLARR